MKINRLAITVFLLAIMSGVARVGTAGNLPDAPPVQGVAATQANPEQPQDAKFAAENRGAQKAVRKRAQVKQGSPPADIHALHPKSK